MIRKSRGIVVLAVSAALGLSLAALSLHALPARAAAPPVPAPPGAAFQPQLLLKRSLENSIRLPLRQDTLTIADELQLYGDGHDILIAVGKGPYSPHTFDGLCDRPCGMTLRDRNNYFDLTGRANIRLTTIVSGFHQVRPLIRLADGTLLVGDQAVGSTADWHPYEISISDVRWLKLDPQRGVTLGDGWVPHPDLSKVDEVGYFDILPGSGVRVAGMPVQSMPPPPPGGWIAVASFEVWGKFVPRNAATTQP